MKARRGSTTSPIRMVNILSASLALFSFRSTRRSLRRTGIHGRGKQFLGVHFPETFKTFDLNSAPSNFLDRIKDLRNGEQRSNGRPIPFALNQFEKRLIARRVVIDRHPALFEFLKHFGDRVRLVQFHPAGSASHIRGHREDFHCRWSRERTGAACHRRFPRQALLRRD